ncbi:RNA-guided endonuclease TnpB family protein [Serratia sp. Se-RSBMAAmG]|nr:RNA-guided endonuclease TnpB family protein [Serratia sp. Se-RSBMAAmG]MDI6976040.1 RNA-guided endonuclease TnpB family protein [Serratia sp. Se-RSBMAAmG]
MIKAYSIRLYPTTEQEMFLNAQFGAVRFVYNKALNIISTSYKRHGLKLYAKKDIKPLLAVAKKSRKYSWLKNYDSLALQQATINLDKAFSDFFDKTKENRYPRFKNKHGYQSSYHPNGKVAGNGIVLPKMKSVIPAKIHRVIEGEVKSITVSRKPTGKYYASVLVENNEAVSVLPVVLQESKIKGFDLGLTHYLIDSVGKKYANPRHLNKAQRNLRRKQRALSRKVKGSKKRAKARLLLAKCHEKVSNARNDFQHKLSRKIVDENQAIIVETLKSKNLMKNKKLSRSIGDAGWYDFVSKLEYKCKEKGIYFVKIDQYYASSKTCHICQYKMDKLSLNTRKWICPCCKQEHDRDINAAKNIRSEGIRKIKLMAVGPIVTAH